MKLEEGLEQLALPLFCLSAKAFGFDWRLVESHSTIFRDPLNRDRRFVPLRLDDAPIKAMLRGYDNVDWLPQADRARECEWEWERLLAVCRRKGVGEEGAAPASEPLIHAAELAGASSRIG